MLLIRGSGGLRDRLTRAVAWNAVGTGFNQGSTFAVNLILARLLSLEAFGQYAMIATTLAVIVALAPLSTAYTATKYVAEYRQRDPARAGRILGLCAGIAVFMSLTAAVGLLFGAERLALLLHEPRLAPGLMIASLVIVFAVSNAFLTGALAGLESYAILGKAGVFSGTSYVLFCALGGLRWGIHGALAGAALSGLLQTGVLWPMLVREARRWQITIQPMGAMREWKIFLMFSLPAALNGFISLPAIWLANAVLVRQPQGYEQMALFTAANSFRIIVLFAPNILNNVGMSILNNQRGAGDEAGFRRLFWANWLATAAVVLLLAVPMAVAGPWLLGLFGQEFRGAHPILLVLIAAALAESLALATSQVIQSQGRIWLSFFGIVAPSYVTLLAVASLMTPRAGALGLALGYLACWLVALVAVVIVARRLGVWAAPGLTRPAEA